MAQISLKRSPIFNLTQEYTRPGCVTAVSRTYRAGPAGCEIITAGVIILEAELLVVSALY